MDFEPVGPSSISGATLRHPDDDALAKTTCLAGCPSFLVDHATVAVLAFVDRVDVVVGSAKKRLKQ